MLLLAIWKWTPKAQLARQRFNGLNKRLKHLWLINGNAEAGRDIGRAQANTYNTCFQFAGFNSCNYSLQIFSGIAEYSMQAERMEFLLCATICRGRSELPARA